MPDSPNPPEEAVALLQALREDEAMRKWFRWLEGVPENLRWSEVHKFAAHAASRGASAGIVDAIKMLGDPEFFEAVRQTLREVGTETRTASPNRARLLGALWKYLRFMLVGSVVAAVPIAAILFRLAESPSWTAPRISDLGLGYLALFAGPLLLPYSAGSLVKLIWTNAAIVPLIIGFYPRLSETGRNVAFALFTVLWFSGSLIAFLAAT